MFFFTLIYIPNETAELDLMAAAALGKKKKKTRAEPKRIGRNVALPSITLHKKKEKGGKKREKKLFHFCRGCPWWTLVSFLGAVRGPLTPGGGGGAVTVNIWSCGTAVRAGWEAQFTAASHPTAEVHV